ncbi:ankyrin [Anaeromyces robustus]|uniref:Ankyrin n=1 Tax=Anaeromyces robustus TaxID=1754192 RepID=A0A1Y1XIU3_9FUNG|nr:ankyrin [Anaeromyces robustus]|eukprot:ORX85680.1 ankyrin [Anaeromyces robustus]
MFKIDDLLTIIRGAKTVEEVKDYIEQNNVIIKNLSNKTFDIVLYVIEYCNCYDVVKYIIQECQYDTFNYTLFNFVYHSSQVPLFTAIIKNKFMIADLLIKNGASVNYCINDFDCRVNLVDYCCFIKKIKDFSKVQLKYILKRGFEKKYITSSLITKFAYNNRVDLLETLFKHYIYDNIFILNFLSIYKNRIPLSNNIIREKIEKEKSKIEISDEVYQKTHHRVNSEVLNILFDYESSNKISDRISRYRILEKAVLNNNYSLVKKIVNNVSFDFNSLSINNVLIQACRVYNGKAVMEFLVQSLLNHNLNDFKKAINFEKILLEASRMNRTYSSSKTNENINGHCYLDTLKFLIEVVFNKNLFSLKDKESYPLDLSFIKDTNSSYYILLLNSLIKINDFRKIKYLIEDKELRRKFDINGKDKNGEYPIVIAMDTNNLRIFKYLIEHGGNVNTIIRDNNRHGISLLSLSLSDKKYRFIQYLLKQKLIFKEDDACSDYSRSRIKANYQDYPSSLIKAICQNDKENVRIIVFPFKNENDKITEDDQTLFNYLNRNRNNKDLLDNSFRFKHKFTALIFSYFIQNQNIFKLLLKKFDINEKDGYGNTLLYYAILKEDINTINDLINLGVDVNYVSNNHGSEYHYALEISIYIGNKDIFYCLVNQENIDLNLMNHKKESLLMTIIKSSLFSLEDKIAMMETVLKKGSRINFYRDDCYSPLIYSIQENSIPLTNLLIKYGANVNFINKIDFKSPLEFALQSKSLPMMKLLIQNGANINVNIGGEMSTLLWYALKEGEMEIVNYLIESGIDLDFKDDILYADLLKVSYCDKLINSKEFKSLLQYNIRHITSFVLQQIIHNNKLDILKILIDNLLDINQRDGYGNTILANAIKASNIPIVNYLIKHNADIYSVNDKGESIYDISYSNCNNFWGRYIYHIIKRLILH